VLDILSSCGLTNVAATMLYHPQPPKERVKPTINALNTNSNISLIADLICCFVVV